MSVRASVLPSMVSTYGRAYSGIAVWVTVWVDGGGGLPPPPPPLPPSSVIPPPPNPRPKRGEKARSGNIESNVYLIFCVP